MDSNFRFRARTAALRSRPSSRSLSCWRKFRKRLALSPGGDGAGWMVLKRPRDSLLGRDGSGGRFRRWALRHASSKIPSCVLSRAAASGDVNNLVISIPIVLASTRIRKSGFQRRGVRTLFRVGRELATHEIARHSDWGGRLDPTSPNPTPRLNPHRAPRHRRCSRDFVPWRFSDAGRRSV